MAAPRQQHVVAVCFPAQGHLNPLMRFCRLLANLPNFIVTFVDLDPLRHRLHSSGGDAAAPAADAHPPPLIRRAHIPWDDAPDVSAGFNVPVTVFFASLACIAPHLKRLILSLDPPVTCLLSDLNITFPTQDVADKLGIPRLALYPCCAARLLLSQYLAEGELVSLDAVEKAPASPEEQFCNLPGLPNFRNRDIPRFNHLKDETIPLWSVLIKMWQACNDRAHAVLVNSFEALEPATFAVLSERCNAPIYDVGLWTEALPKESATSLWKEDDDCISWLDQQPISSVLYTSFGSIALLSEAQYKEFLHGILASQQRFLWVLRPDLVPDMDFPSTVEYINSNSHGKGLVIRWAPQLQVLAHPSVGGFLTHCGWNSVSEAIAHGVPMLCWPYFGDQPMNAHCVTDEWKVGLRMESGNNDTALIERGEIEKAVRALMEGSEGNLLRENAANLKEKSQHCFQENGSSQAKLKSFINSLWDSNCS